MKKQVQTTALMAALISGALTTGIAQAGNYAEAKVWADNQAVSEGTVTAKKVTAEANGGLDYRDASLGGGEFYIQLLCIPDQGCR
ncbi:hypothetical protein [Marinobacter sp. ELB17]|uniref:hypothetical protein n=1 Tax=Marinobacter sp. ELB17 TaxID=270374 RepID=UPI0000F374A2|nr:hypothetical protein [Marinobacter sp. ELB17]EBA00524.1 hypothetical protein MELB17_21845 [Marinobacter sp. ELB17]